MSLSVGSRLGHYDVTALIGEGGMGQVYQATDTKLNRQVALKVLPEAFATDPDRLARFQREAQVLASLNHPNIAQIHGLEEADGVRALVLELVEGPTLADRIKQGPIPLDEALPIAKQIAEALEAAHEQGVIHRDLKPANVKVKDDGTVKVLDFGLAKLHRSEQSQETALTSTTMATAPGVVLGTLPYMSPEQTRGHPVDKRSDIWAFGCVLYEMLTGQRAFAGTEHSDILARIIEREPDFGALPVTLPAPIQRLLRRSLAKEPKQRLSDIADARLDIDEAVTGPSSEVASPRRTQPASWRQTLPWISAGLALAVVAGFGGWHLNRPAEPLTTRFTLDTEGTGVFVAISPDGRTVAFGQEGTIYVRELDQLEAVPVSGVETVRTMDGFSPDGEWLLISDEESLKRVPLAGGPVVTVEDLVGPSRDWGPGDLIVRGGNTGLWIVSPSGRDASQLTVLEPGLEVMHANPTFLPNGRAVVFERHSDRAPEVAVAELDTGEVRSLLPGSNPHVTTSGHLVFWREGTLWAAPFDEGRLAVRGDAVPVIEGVATQPLGGALYDLSTDGTLLYRTGGALLSRMEWIDQDGRREEIDLPPRAYREPRVSPDGHRLVYVVREDRTGQVNHGNVFVYDLETGVEEQFTFSGRDQGPVWSPDGLQIAFFSVREEGPGVYVKPVQSRGGAIRLTEGTDFVANPTDWLPDGETIVGMMGPVPPGLGMFRIGADAPPRRLVQNGRVQHSGRVSPNGRWIAYTDSSGVNSVDLNIYVSPFPEMTNGSQHLIGQGVVSLWGPDGDELFVHGFSGLQAIRVEAEDVFERGQSRTLFTRPWGEYGLDLAPDGRFLVLSTPNSVQPGNIVVVQHWFEELTRLVPID